MKITFNYLSMIFFKFTERIRNRHRLSEIKRFKKYPALLHWTGADSIYVCQNKIQKKHKLIDYYSKIKGDIRAVTIISQNQISYNDHLPRIQTDSVPIDTARFSKPCLSAQSAIILDLKKLSENELKRAQHIVEKNPYFADVPEPFTYSAMETGKSLQKPVCIGLPAEYKDDYIFNSENILLENVLHLPIKITRAKALELNKEERVVANSQMPIDNKHLYIPEELSFVVPFVNYICGLELEYNPYFADDFYIFLTVSHSTVPTQTMQRRGGWHIDGHQGHERMQMNGSKLRCDRQYLLCNALPTEFIQHSFDFSDVRAYCKQQLCHIDSVNMQDVIENNVSIALSNHAKSMQMEINKLFFVNPYMVHKAQVNMGPPVDRTFMRILVSTFKRDRLGDTVNPILGPLWRYKIKTITDIHEMKRDHAI